MNYNMMGLVWFLLFAILDAISVFVKFGIFVCILELHHEKCSLFYGGMIVQSQCSVFCWMSYSVIQYCMYVIWNVNIILLHISLLWLYHQLIIDLWGLFTHIVQGCLADICLKHIFLSKDINFYNLHVLIEIILVLQITVSTITTDTSWT